MPIPFDSSSPSTAARSWVRSSRGAGADELERVLAAGNDETYVLDASDGRYTIALRRIVWVKRYARESRVGFGI